MPIVPPVSLCLILLLSVFQRQHGVAQSLQSIRPQRPVVCYYKAENSHVRVPPSQAFRQNTSARVKTSSFVVEYIGFPDDNQARNAFQHAIEIWEQALISPVPIRVRAEWRNLDTGVLGQALWGSAYSNFGGEQHRNTFYPVALAEKIAGRELNGTNEPDIVASFNANMQWYTGLDGNTPAGKMDLVTIVLHEIAHGLGITDSYHVEGQQGTVGLFSQGAVLPFVFDVFVDNQSGQNLLHHFESPSTALGSALQSSELYFDGIMSAETLEGLRPELFAPSPFDDGSSISHLDEASFSDPNSADRLMTPQIAFAESVHEPGALLLSMLSDMGWVSTSVAHEPLKDTETLDGTPFEVKAMVRSDNGYEADQVRLHYTSDGLNYTTVSMATTGDPDEFAANLPGRTSRWAYAYYLSVVDIVGRTFTFPGKIQERGKVSQQATYYFQIGPDEKPPEITHQPVTFIAGGTRELQLEAEVTDNLAVKEVTIEYRVDDAPLATEVMLNTSSDAYAATLALPELETGAQVQYRIIATDEAGLGNTSVLPAQGFYNVSVTGILPVQPLYVNNFDQSTFDFFGDHFSISTPAGFDNGAIHSDHPYPDGGPPNDESHYTFQLQVPIEIDQSNPVIQFDEIVLVEPGDDGSVFGDDGFFDYVIVEGSVDGGQHWTAFADGYDSRDDDVWLSRYNSVVTDFNSQATGEPDLYRQRRINMLASDDFSHGDKVLIRFRLFADQAAHGWGWAIDNLSIQAPVTNTEQPLNPEFSIYPVPAGDELFVELQTDGFSASIEILDLIGHTVFLSNISGAEEFIRARIETALLSEGAYILRVRTKGRIYTQKFLKRSGNHH